MAELFICPRCLKSHRKGWYLETRIYRCERCGYIGRGYHRVEGFDLALAACIDQMMAGLQACHVIDIDDPPPASFDIALLQPRDEVNFRSAVREFDRHIERLVHGQQVTRPSVGVLARKAARAFLEQQGKG